MCICMTHMDIQKKYFKLEGLVSLIYVHSFYAACFSYKQISLSNNYYYLSRCHPHVYTHTYVYCKNALHYQC